MKNIIFEHLKEDITFLRRETNYGYKYIYFFEQAWKQLEKFSHPQSKTLVNSAIALILKWAIMFRFPAIEICIFRLFKTNVILLYMHCASLLRTIYILRAHCARTSKALLVCNEAKLNRIKNGYLLLNKRGELL